MPSATYCACPVSRFSLSPNNWLNYPGHQWRTTYLGFLQFLEGAPSAPDKPYRRFIAEDLLHRLLVLSHPFKPHRLYLNGGFLHPFSKTFPAEAVMILNSAYLDAAVENYDLFYELEGVAPAEPMASPLSRKGLRARQLIEIALEAPRYYLTLRIVSLAEGREDICDHVNAMKEAGGIFDITDVRKAGRDLAG